MSWFDFGVLKGMPRPIYNQTGDAQGVKSTLQSSQISGDLGHAHKDARRGGGRHESILGWGRRIDKATREVADMNDGDLKSQ